MIDFNEYPANKPTNKAGKGQILCLCECPGWCSTGFQVAYFSQKKQKFDYPDSPNDMLDENVEAWVILDI